MSKTKPCNTCGEELSLQMFHKCKRSKDGHSNRCKKCRKEYLEKFRAKRNADIKEDRKNNPEKYRSKDRERYDKNKEKKLEACKKYREKNSEAIKQRKKSYYQKNKKPIVEKSKKYHENNKEDRLKYMKEYYAGNRTKILNYHKIYQIENKDKIDNYRNNNQERIEFLNRKHREKRRTLEENIEFGLTKNEISFIKSQFSNKCFKCGTCEDLCLDHHFPLSDGFGLSLENAVILCRSCNSTKKNKHPEKFYNEKELKELHKLGIAETKEQLMALNLIKDYNIKVPDNLKKISEIKDFVDKYVLENFVVH
jgi:5-methylcytosine-specific restriction endonuclease McrA